MRNRLQCIRLGLTLGRAAASPARQQAQRRHGCRLQRVVAQVQYLQRLEAGQRCLQRAQPVAVHPQLAQRGQRAQRLERRRVDAEVEVCQIAEVRQILGRGRADGRRAEIRAARLVRELDAAHVEQQEAIQRAVRARGRSSVAAAPMADELRFARRASSGNSTRHTSSSRKLSSVRSARVASAAARAALRCAVSARRASAAAAAAVAAALLLDSIDSLLFLRRAVVTPGAVSV